MKTTSHIAALAVLVTAVSTHTWIEQLTVVAPNGTMVGQPGFIRGNVLRSNPAFGDPSLVNLIPPDGGVINQIPATMPMCKSSQSTPNQTEGSPRLQAQAGATIALRYQENGHVTLPQNQPGKPPNSGAVFVYGTTQPKDNESFLDVHRQWTPDGKGGDGRGVLLSTQNFDDGQCYQINGGTISMQRRTQFPHTANALMGADLWCQQDVQIPASAPNGKPYTLYWVWDWPTLPGTAGFPDGKQEIYTSCMDVDIADAAVGSNKLATNSYIAKQDYNSAAVSSQVNDISNPTAVPTSGRIIPFSGVSAQTASSSNAGKSSSTPPPAPASSSLAAITPPAMPSSIDPVVTTSSTSLHSIDTTSPAAVPQSSSLAAASSSRSGKPTVIPMSALSSPLPQVSAGGFFGSSSVSAASGVASSGVVSSTASAIVTQTSATTMVTVMSTTTGVITATATKTQIDYSTVMETVYVTVKAKRSDVPVATSLSCSKTRKEYKLRVRSPFYIFSGPNTDC